MAKLIPMRHMRCDQIACQRDATDELVDVNGVTMGYYCPAHAGEKLREANEYEQSRQPKS